MTMKAAIYARYSSDLQRPASIEDQVRQCRMEIARRGWQEVEAYFDRETPGTVSRGRSGYQSLQEAARKRRFDVIVVDELSRLSRDPAELAGLWQKLKFWQIGLRALGDGLDTVVAPSAAAPILLVKSLVSEAEIEANAHRSRRGLEGRVLACHHAGGAIYGYRTRAVHADRPGDPPGTGRVVGYDYLIHEEEAEIVRRVFSLYAGGMSPRRIAALLNAEGIPPPGARWRNRKGVASRTWSHGAIAGARRRGSASSTTRSTPAAWYGTEAPGRGTRNATASRCGESCRRSAGWCGTLPTCGSCPRTCGLPSRHDSDSAREPGHGQALISATAGY